MLQDLDRLQEIASAAMQIDAWSAFARFAELRARGVRQQSLVQLSEFLAAAQDWSEADRLAFVRWLLPLVLPGGSAVLLPQPLLEALIEPTVREWSAQQPCDAEAELWLGLLRCDDPIAHIERALELDPQCRLASRTLAQWILADVEYNQHHLPDFYIHDPRVDLRALERAALLIDSGQPEPWAAAAAREVDELRQAASAWLREHPAPGDFALY